METQADNVSGLRVMSRRTFGYVTMTTLLAARKVSAQGVPTSPFAPRVVCLLPLSPSPTRSEMEYVVRALDAFYDVGVTLLPPVLLPETAYYPARRRYRAEKLLRYLGDRLGKQGFRIMGLTAADISTTKGNAYDWGILGLADMPGPSCVVSSFRCTKRANSSEQATMRLGKTAVHELGHTFGLPHCQSVGCLMEDAGGSVLTSDRERDLCKNCRTFLTGQKLLREAAGEIPWNDPG